jgi:hypothetical protein
MSQVRSVVRTLTANLANRVMAFCLNPTCCAQVCPTRVQHIQGSSGYHPINRKRAHLAIRKMHRCTTLQCAQCGVWGGCRHPASVAAHVITYPLFPLNRCLGVESLVLTCTRCNSLPPPNGFTAWCGVWTWRIRTREYDKQFTERKSLPCLRGAILCPTSQTYSYHHRKKHMQSPHSLVMVR